MCLPPDYLKLKWIIPATDEILLNSRSIESDDKTNINPDDLISTSEMTEKKTIIRDSKISDSLLGIFGEGMFWGFFAIIMPCIFPMIPLTVSFFMKQSKSRSEGISKAITYGVSINVIYVALGLLVTVLFGGDALNALATNPWFNLAFFFLFVVFAISFFGAFEITLPAKWVDGSDTLSNKGGSLVYFLWHLLWL